MQFKDISWSKDFNLIFALVSLIFVIYFTCIEINNTYLALRLANGLPTASLIGTLGILLLSLYIQARTFTICFFSYAFDISKRNSKPPQEDENHTDEYLSVIIPAFNESKNITPTLQSVIDSGHTDLEILVVDDGSTDSTSTAVNHFISENPHCQIKLIQKINTGKWDAINHGINQSSYDLILIIDADSRVKKNAISNGIQALKKYNADVVCGHVAVRNHQSAIGKLQGLEYALTNCFRRRAQSFFNGVLIVPGPFGLYKKKVLSEISLYNNSQVKVNDSGPVSGDTFAEDCDLTVNALCLGFKVHYESTATVLTKAPSNLLDLANQRYRWNRGHMQVSKKYIRSIWKASIPVPFSVFLWLINTLFIDSLLLPSLFLAGTATGFFLLLSGSVGQFLPQLALTMLGIEFNLAMYCISCENEPSSYLKYSPLLPFYRIILTFSWVAAAIDEARSKKMTW